MPACWSKVASCTPSSVAGGVAAVVTTTGRPLRFCTTTLAPAGAIRVQVFWRGMDADAKGNSKEKAAPGRDGFVFETEGPGRKGLRGARREADLAGRGVDQDGV